MRIAKGLPCAASSSPNVAFNTAKPRLLRGVDPTDDPPVEPMSSTVARPASRPATRMVA